MLGVRALQSQKRRAGGERDRGDAHRGEQRVRDVDRRARGRCWRPRLLAIAVIRPESTSRVQASICSRDSEIAVAPVDQHAVPAAAIALPMQPQSKAAIAIVISQAATFTIPGCGASRTLAGAPIDCDRGHDAGPSVRRQLPAPPPRNDDAARDYISAGRVYKDGRGLICAARRSISRQPMSRRQKPVGKSIASTAR